MRNLRRTMTSSKLHKREVLHQSLSSTSDLWAGAGDVAWWLDQFLCASFCHPSTLFCFLSPFPRKHIRGEEEKKRICMFFILCQDQGGGEEGQCKQLHHLQWCIIQMKLLCCSDQPPSLYIYMEIRKKLLHFVLNWIASTPRH